MTFDDFKALIVVIATVVGICSGAYALLQSYRTNAAQAEAKRAVAESNAEAQRLSDRSTALESLQQAVTVQGSVIDGLHRGLDDCIERDNEKGEQINFLNVKIAHQGRTINDLSIEVAQLKARIHGI